MVTTSFDTILPYAFALVIAIPFFVILRQMVFSFIRLKEKEIKILGLQAGNENRVQAFERMTLFLERIKPSNLVTRFNDNLATHEFVFLTEKSIQEEFDYNASQQLYISKNSWNTIVISKNQLIQVLHNTAKSLGENASLEEFKTVFLMNYINEGDFIMENIESLKKEFLLISLNNK